MAHLPSKGPFCAALAAFTALFHLFGNATRGYVNSGSLFAWAHAVYQNGQKTDTDDQLGLVAPVFVLAIFALRAGELKKVPIKPWAGGAALVAAALGLHVAGYVIQQGRVSIVAFLLGVYGIMGLFWGRAWLRAVAFPYVLTGFCIPVTAYLNNLTLRLQIFSAAASTFVAKTLLNLHIEQKGTQIYHAATKTHDAFPITVAAACSGMRSAMVSLLVVSCYAFLTFKSRRAKWILIGSSPFIALGANILRLIVANLAGDMGGPAAVVKVEGNAGLFTYPVALIAVALVGRLLPDKRWSAGLDDAPAPASKSSATPGRAWGWAAGVVAATAASWAALGHVHSAMHIGPPGVRVGAGEIRNETGAVVRTNAVLLPEFVADYVSHPVPVSDTDLAYLPADTTFGRRSYVRADQSFGAVTQVVLMGSDRTSIHRPEYCLTGAGWTVEKSSPCTIPLKDGKTLQATRLDLRRPPGDPSMPPDSAVYVYWYVAGGLRAQDMVRCQWSMIRSLILKSEMQRWAYVSFLAMGAPGAEDDTFSGLSRLVAAALPGIEAGPVDEAPAPFFRLGTGTR
jgi:exosortase